MPRTRLRCLEDRSSVGEPLDDTQAADPTIGVAALRPATMTRSLSINHVVNIFRTTRHHCTNFNVIF